MCSFDFALRHQQKVPSTSRDEDQLPVQAENSCIFGDRVNERLVLRRVPRRSTSVEMKLLVHNPCTLPSNPPIQISISASKSMTEGDKSAEQSIVSLKSHAATGITP